MTDSKPIRVLLDIDGVVADFLTAALSVVHEVSGQLYRAEDLPTWDIWDHVGREHEGACYERYRAEGFCAGLQPYPGAVDGVQRLLSVAEVHVVTSPIHGKHWYYERAEWVRQHLGIAPKQVLFTGHKEHVAGDILIDDRVLHVRKWADMHPLGVGIVWDQPYNRAEDTNGLLRARSWDDVLDAVSTARSWEER